jgi:hypothetical protein
MANPGLFITLSALLLAVDGSAAPAVETPPAPACKFTLEREAPAADDELWVLTCHRMAPAAVSAEPVVQRRVVKPVTSPETAIF